ncbi:hypothetical protein KJE20_01991 [Pyrenophora tritici-repentis]|nr:hypothetical protein KJE20_01991 [Pyrenophora tritici-repentis]
MTNQINQSDQSGLIVAESASAASATTTSASATSPALPVTENLANTSVETLTNSILKLNVPSIGSHPATPHDSAVEKDKSDGDDFAKDYAAREDRLSDEELYLVCKYQALLVLALHKAKPFVYLNHPELMRELDDFHSGHLNEDGLEMQHAPRRDEAGANMYLEMRAHVGAKLAERIIDRARANYRDEPKNRLTDGKNPEHAAFTRVIISAKQFKDWCTIVKNPKYKGVLDYPEKSGPVLKHLRKVVDGQYDYEMWQRVPPEPKFNQLPRLIGEGMTEEFQYDSKYPYKILSVIDITIPGTNERFFQMDIFNDILLLYYYISIRVLYQSVTM